MRKIFEYFGLFSLVCFSFYLTNRTVNVAKNMDSIMIQIKDNMNDYKVSKQEPYMDYNTIIPGLNGYKVNIDKSYNYMKKVGIYDPSLYIYDVIKVSNEIKNNLDKYIIKGNKDKKMVSIVIYYDDNNIDELLKKIGNTKINFIINDSYINDISNNNYNFIIDKANNIDNYIDNFKDKQKELYCFNKDMNDNFKNICLKNNLGTISTDIINTRYLYNTKRKLESGAILVYDGDVINEINTIINYIESKGYKIETLDNHLKESL